MRARVRVGFTILEMLIVMIIVGVLVAIVAPRVRDIGTKNNVHSARYKVASALALARATAVQQSASALFRMKQDTISVVRTSGVNSPVTILNPSGLKKTYGVSMTVKDYGGASPSQPWDVVYDARGIASLGSNWYQIV